jgi:hypothetical protein
MSIGIPVVNAPNLYVDNLELSWTSDEVVAIAAGRARNSTDENDIIVESALAVSNIVSGVNGLDTGTVAASTMYAVYVIGSSYGVVEPAGLLSLASNSAPTLPEDYDMYRRIGWVLTDSSSDNLLFWQYGSDKTRQYYYDVAIAELAGGSATTLTAVDLATSVPPIATQVLMKVTYTPNGATDVAEFGPYGGVSTTGVVQFGYGVAGAQVGMLNLPAALNSSVPTVMYKVTSGDTLSLATVGYADYL